MIIFIEIFLFCKIKILLYVHICLYCHRFILDFPFGRTNPLWSKWSPRFFLRNCSFFYKRMRILNEILINICHICGIDIISFIDIRNFLRIFGLKRNKIIFILIDKCIIFVRFFIITILFKIWVIISEKSVIWEI